MPTLHISSPHFDHHQQHLHLSPSTSSDMSMSGEIGAHRESSDCMSEVDLEMGSVEGKLHLSGDNKAHNRMRDCRICHLRLEGNEEECGVAIELGCSCKGDLGAAHKKCTETWFKIKGDMICEICGATAVNVAGEQQTSDVLVTTAVSTAPAAPMILMENGTFWHSRRIMNILLACMVLAFIISWLFHFRVFT